MKKVILLSILLSALYWQKAAAQVRVHVRVAAPCPRPRAVVVRPAAVVVRPVRPVVVVRPAPVVAVVPPARVVRVYRW